MNTDKTLYEREVTNPALEAHQKYLNDGKTDYNTPLRSYVSNKSAQLRETIRNIAASGSTKKR